MAKPSRCITLGSPVNVIKIFGDDYASMSCKWDHLAAIKFDAAHDFFMR
jgi:hypothetical protein